jgi:hypothetical protein
MEKPTLDSPSARPPAVGSIDNVRADASDRRTRATTDLVFRRGDTLVIRGWVAAAYDAATAVQSVSVLVDDEIPAQVAAQVVRRDVAHALAAANLEHSGFVAVLAATRLARGSHSLSVSVASGPGSPFLTIPLSYPFEIVDDDGLTPDLAACAPSRIGGSIDTWTALPRVGPGGAPELDVFVRGWACDFDTETPVSDVFGVVDGRHTGRALMGYPRPDVALLLGSPAYEACGFRFRMILPAAIANGGAIEVVAVSGDRAHRASLVSPKSTPRLPVFRERTHAATEASPVDAEAYERLVLEDVLELDRLRDEHIAAQMT